VLFYVCLVAGDVRLARYICPGITFEEGQTGSAGHDGQALHAVHDRQLVEVQAFG
jgi:hypothetical protein